MNQDHREMRKACRKLDVCLKCMKFDKVICPRVKASVLKWRNEMESKWPGYWVAWDRDCAPKFAIGENKCNKFSVTRECMQCLLEYMMWKWI